MPFFATDDGVKIYFEDHGEGVPIIFIHGWSGSRLHFAFQVPFFKKNYRVITFDQRGLGVSDKPQYGLTLKRLAKDLKQLIDYLKLDNIHLVGWSMGAHVLLKYVENYGCQGLTKTVIVDMSPCLINDDSWNLGLYHGKFDHKANLKTLSAMSEDYHDFMESFIKKVAPNLEDQDFKLALKTALRNTPYILCAYWIAITAADFREVLELITVPTLIAYGEKSTLYSADTFAYMAQKIPNSSLAAFPNLTHMLVLEDPNKFNKTLESFLK